MRLLRNYDENDVLSKTLMLYFAFQHGAIGAFFMLNDNPEEYSHYFKGMIAIMPLTYWGLLLILSTASFIFATVQEGKLEYIFMLIAGLSGMITFALLAMASIELSIHQTNTVNYIVIASIDLIVAILGGVALWLRRDS